MVNILRRRATSGAASVRGTSPTRRDEGGEGGLGGPLWSPVAPLKDGDSTIFGRSAGVDLAGVVDMVAVVDPAGVVVGLASARDATTFWSCVVWVGGFAVM